MKNTKFSDKFYLNCHYQFLSFKAAIPLELEECREDLAKFLIFTAPYYNEAYGTINVCPLDYNYYLHNGSPLSFMQSNFSGRFEPYLYPPRFMINNYLSVQSVQGTLTGNLEIFKYCSNELIEGLLKIWHDLFGINEGSTYDQYIKIIGENYKDIIKEAKIKGILK